jgi:hypothetical protein
MKVWKCSREERYGGRSLSDFSSELESNECRRNTTLSLARRSDGSRDHLSHLLLGSPLSGCALCSVFVCLVQAYRLQRLSFTVEVTSPRMVDCRLHVADAN